MTRTSLAAALALCACAGSADKGTDTDTDTDADAPPEWTAVQSEDPRGMYLGVWGTADDDVWIAGGQLEAGVLLRGGPDGFTEVALPEGTPMLTWVHGTGPSDIWVAGVAGTLLHWDGTSFTDHTVAQDEAFWGVFARSATDALAVGGPFALTGEEPVAFRWDGEAWSAVAMPDELPPLDSWFKAFHDGERYHVVGAAGVALTVDDEVAVAATGVGADLVTAHAAPGAAPLVVGGRNTGVVLAWDGARWNPAGTAIAGLNGVHDLGDGRALVVGERGFGGIYDRATEQITEIPSLTFELVHGSWVSPEGTAWGVGGNFFTPGDYIGVILTAEL